MMSRNADSKGIILSVVLSILPCSAAGAQGVAAQNTNAPPGPAAPQIHIVNSEVPINLGGEAVIEIDDLAIWLKPVGSDLSKIVLFLDDIPFKITPLPRGQNQLAFPLKQTSDTKAAWSQLLGRPVGFSRTVRLSVGLANSSPLPSQNITLAVVYEAWFWCYVVLLLVLVSLFVWMARSSNIIRDSTTLPTAPTDYKPYSLAKFQMAVWFFLVLAAFLFIWIVTGQYDSITPQVLGLMGIASGTALGSAVIDGNKNRAATNTVNEMRPRCQAIEQEIAVLDAKVAELTARVNAGAQADAADRDALKAAQAELAAKKLLWDELDLKMKDAASRMSLQKSDSFLEDLLSDANGYSFHRFQIFVWTIVLGILFVRSVWAELAMPQFSETLLGLMGVSAGTYLGFKFPERPSDPAQGRA